MCTARLEGVVDADFITGFHWSAATPAISARGVRLQWVVFDAELPSPETCFLGTMVGVVARVRLQVVRMERFLPRIGQLTTRGPPFVGRLEVDGMVWDCRATEVGLSMSLADERAWLRCLEGYAGSGGSEWAGGETDSDDDFYFPNGGSDGDDRDVYDYL